MIRPSTRWFAIFTAVTLLGAGQTVAQTAPPSPEEFLGYSLGEHFTGYESVQEYSEALAEASPLVEYVPYGVTPERRELFQLVIASPEHRARLPEILAANRELTLPSTSESRAAQIAATNPAIVYFSYGVHGNESSSSEAALWTAWDLASGAPEVAGVLESAVVIIDPVTNPDGRARYVSWYRSVVGDVPNADPDAREHSEPWPGGRYNHFYFDLNRDWAWGTQPETRARLATWDKWNPQVHVDFHEMGYNSSYFFFPAADPINPIYPEYILDWSARIGQGNAAAFDSNGWAYFTGDNYDFFYPGYGDTWPGLTGAIGMTYEQGGSGSAGLAVETSSGDTLTLAERATHHWVAGRATLRTVAQGKNDLLLSYAAGQRAIGLDEPDVLLVPGEDESRIRALVDHLKRQGIQVVHAASSFDADAEAYPGYEDRNDFPAGTYLVPARQPRGRLATTLLQPNTELTAEFSYDISAWSLPYAYGVEAHQVESSPDGDWTEVPAASGEPADVSAPVTAYGYLVLPGYATAEGIVDYLELGGDVRVITDETTIAGREWPYGTWFLPTGSSATARQRVTAAGLGAHVTPVASGLSTDGVDLGSSAVEVVDLPNVAVLTGEGVSPLSFGAHRFFLERRLGLPFDAILVADVGRTDLHEYDVIVIPEASGLDDSGQEALA
ncbi:MAG TPA: M14 metallopeptidase family protein, partial [Longimicrobiaceae bacterium]|nr:M14 metallopeptidase family protein [Longimicrobiaceae bacterium]